MVRIGLIGAGNIGEEVIRQSREKGFEIGPIVTTSGVYDGSKVQKWKNELSGYLRENQSVYKIAEPGDYLAPLRETDIVFLAASTRDNGKEAYEYMCGLLPHVPVITCEKGALSSSSHFHELLPEIKKGRIGFRATVGGGTSLLKELQDKVRLDFNGSLYAVVNGTLNYIFDRVSHGRSLGETVYRARILGFAEPGTKDPMDVVNAEACKDVPRKSAILYNVFVDSVGHDRFIDASTIMSSITPLTQDTFTKLIRDIKNRRYIVSITPRGEDVDDDVICGFKFTYNEDNWVLQGGFRRITDNPLYERLLLEDVDNAILITKGKGGSKGEYPHGGPGAGAPPTVDAMMLDMDDMLKSGAHRS